MDPRFVAIFVVIVVWVVLRTLVSRRSTPDQPRRSWLSGWNRTRRHKARLREPRRPRPYQRRPPLNVVTEKPHPFANYAPKPGTWFDLTTDARPSLLAQHQLPDFSTPEALARWLNVSMGELAWLAQRCSRWQPREVAKSHYVYNWKPKRSGGLRLIESPKARLKAVQQQIYTGLLHRVPISVAAHGFVTGRSIVTNAAPHVGRDVVVKFDLQDFYLTVGVRRVLRLYRRLGYSREIALWLTALTLSAIPGNLPLPPGDNFGCWRYRSRHLPQGAPSSPALANIVASGMDQRLAGLAHTFGATYTRYADDLTFSGDKDFASSLRNFIPLVEQIIREEGFRTNRGKRQVLRQHQRQVVAGVVVNEHTNICRRDFDRLKAVLHRCATLGPASQNRDQHPDFAAHLRGRIAHVAHLNPARGEKLWAAFARIRW